MFITSFYIRGYFQLLVTNAILALVSMMERATLSEEIPGTTVFVSQDGLEEIVTQVWKGTFLSYYNKQL